jgi:hypothetical protein
LSQKDPKRPGSRDISELKARLGLKKGAAGGPAAAARPNGAGGVVPPPGLNLPPPPGARPAGPVIPNAADDPFGAMNALASYGAAQRAPEIVIVNDGKPVEQVGKSKMMVGVAVGAGVGVLLMIIGFVLGGSGGKKVFENQAIERSQRLKGRVEELTKQIGAIKQEFEAKGKGGSGQLKVFEERDVAEDLSRALAAQHLTNLTGGQQAAFANVQHVTGASDVLQFYAQLQELQDLIIEHGQAAAFDEAIIKAGKEQLAGFTPPAGSMLAADQRPEVALMLSPTGGSQLVELGALLCGADIKAASEEPSGKCPENVPPIGYAYRTGPKEGWERGQVGFWDEKKGFPTEKLLFIANNGTMQALLMTSKATVAEERYFQRLAVIYEKVVKLYESGDKLTQVLAQKARASKKFTWFQ